MVKSFTDPLQLLETESIKAIGRQIAKTQEQHFFIVYLGKQPTSTQQDTVFMRLLCTVQYDGLLEAVDAY